MRFPIPMIPHSPIQVFRYFHRGSFTYSVIPGISYRFISKYDIMCFSCIHPYHSRNLHTILWLFHTGFIGWTKSVDESICIQRHPYPQQWPWSFPYMKDSVSATGPWLSLLQYSLCSHSGISGLRKNRKKDRDDSDFSGTLLVSLSLRRIYHMNQTPKHLVHGYLWMRLCF